MKRYFTTLALLLLLLTLLIPSSLPTATAAPSSEAEEEYHPGLNAKQLTIHKREVTTRDCSNLPLSICTPNGSDDLGEEEYLSVDMILPGGATVETVETEGGHPPKHSVTVYCFENKNHWSGHTYKMVEFFVQYPPEYNGGRSERVAAHVQGIYSRQKTSGLWELDGSHACSHTARGTILQQSKGTVRYTLTDAPHSDSDDIADAYDACPSEPGPASNDGCPATCESTKTVDRRFFYNDDGGTAYALRDTHAFTVQFTNLGYCYDGTHVWWQTTPQARAYVRNEVHGGANWRNILEMACVPIADPVNQRLTSITVTCNLAIANKSFSHYDSIEAEVDRNGDSSFEIRNRLNFSFAATFGASPSITAVAASGAEDTRYYTLRIYSDGQAEMSGIGNTDLFYP